NGNQIDSTNLIGKKLVVYFYPKDNTPGCTAQACNIRDNYEQLLANNIQIIGVSADSLKSHQSFTTKYELPFPLLLDEDKKVIEAFGVWGTKKFMGKVYDGIHRTTFLFNEEGKVVSVIDKPDTKNHSEEILKEFGI
ncbi:MAG: thioredoxin-dependent thiol peroxidase, partial [Crocinitomicaceae bacterium]|nr:thioredoxin-dependent thiol peroxidase [Crocinitomicaceae bacterium]